MDTSDRVAAIRSLSGKPEDLLQFYMQNASMDTSSLDALVRALLRGSSKAERSAVIVDERFQKLLVTLSGRLESADGRQLAMLANALSYCSTPTAEMKDVVQRLADVVVRRENQFTPRNLATLQLSFSALGVRDLAVVEFIRQEAIKTMNEFGPSDLTSLMEGFRRAGLFPRDLFELVVEKMTDDVHRFHVTDITEALRVLSAVGLAKGFLVAKLRKLVFENMHEFTPTQLTSCFVSLAKLRFIDSGFMHESLNVLLSPANIETLPAANAAQLMMAMAMVEYDTSSGDAAVSVQNLFNHFMKHHQNKSGGLIMSAHITDAIWALCYFKQHTQNIQQISALLTEMYEHNRPQPAVLRNLLEAHQFLTHKKLTPAALTPDAANLPAAWLAAATEAVKKDTERNDSSRLYAEVLMEMDALRGPYKVSTDRTVAVPNTPFFADFYIPSLKLVVDIDNLSKSSPRFLRQKIYEQQGINHVTLNYWQWRRCRTNDDKTLLLQDLLKPILQKFNKI